jgi:hypothetical protein
MGLFGKILKVGKNLAGKALKIAAPQVSAGIAIAKKVAQRGLRKNVKAAVATGGAAIVGGAVAVKRFARTPGGAAVMAGGGGVAAGSALNMMVGGGGGTGRRRRINPGNVRAMRRAVRRVEAGAKLYSKLFRMRHGQIHGAPKVAIKGGRRRAA